MLHGDETGWRVQSLKAIRGNQPGLAVVRGLRGCGLVSRGRAAQCRGCRQAVRQRRVPARSWCVTPTPPTRNSRVAFDAASRATFSASTSLSSPQTRSSRVEKAQDLGAYPPGNSNVP